MPGDKATRHIHIVDRDPLVGAELARIISDVGDTAGEDLASINMVVTLAATLGEVENGDTTPDIWLVNVYDDSASIGAVTALQKTSDPLGQWIILHTATAEPLGIGAIPAMQSLSLPIKRRALIKALEFAEVRLKARPQKIGAYYFDGVGHILRHESGRKDILTEKEAAILSLLLQQNGARVARRDLLEQVWGYSEAIDTHTLATHIYRLRQKLEADSSSPKILVSDEGGYRLNASPT